MYYVRKLKPDRSITGLVPAIISVTAFFATMAIFGQRPAFFVLSVAFALQAALSALMYTRTRSTGDLLGALYLGFACLACLSVPDAIYYEQKRPYLLFVVGMVVTGVFLGYLAVNRRLKWRGRELLELAAMPVEQVGNGYTARPLPAGRVETSRKEVLAFAEFAARNLIALPIVESDRVVLRLVKMGSEYHPSVWLSPDYEGRTWVALGFDGNVAVNLSQEDYLDYREDLSFDQLCASLGSVFVEFLDLFRKGHEVRIMDRMDALRMGIFS
jgi:hypothetical protein